MPNYCPQVVVVEQNGSFQVKIPKNFVCEHCFGAFRSSYHLKRHILIHTGKSLALIQRRKVVYSLGGTCTHVHTFCRVKRVREIEEKD